MRRKSKKPVARSLRRNAPGQTIPDGSEVARKVNARIDREKKRAAVEMAKQLTTLYDKLSPAATHASVRINTLYHPLRRLASKYARDEGVIKEAMNLMELRNWSVEFSESYVFEVTPGESVKTAESAEIADPEEDYFWKAGYQ